MPDETTNEGIDLPGVGTATDWPSQLRSNWNDLSSFLFQSDATALDTDAIAPPAVRTSSVFAEQRGDPSTTDLDSGEVLLYNSDGSGTGSAGDLVYAVNDGGTIKTSIIAQRSNATA